VKLWILFHEIFFDKEKTDSRDCFQIVGYFNMKNSWKIGYRRIELKLNINEMNEIILCILVELPTYKILLFLTQVQYGKGVPAN